MKKYQNSSIKSDKYLFRIEIAINYPYNMNIRIIYFLNKKEKLKMKFEKYIRILFFKLVWIKLAAFFPSYGDYLSISFYMI